jgi:hypothetical protein
LLLVLVGEHATEVGSDQRLKFGSAGITRWRAKVRDG